MMKPKQTMQRCLALFLVLGVSLGLGSACANTQPSRGPDASPELDGAALWRQTCRQCHTYRSLAKYSDAHWETAMFHMRVRANLTGPEYRSILAYLKASR